MSFATGILDSVYPANKKKASAQETIQPACFFKMNAKSDLLSILDRPYHIFIEMGEYRLLEKTLKRLHAEQPRFALSITTPTAYRHPVAESIAIYLNRAFHLQNQKIMQIQTCLQEALANAIIHGNLELEGKYQSLEHFNAHFAEIDERLAQSPYNGRRILIAAREEDNQLKLAVCDEGEGGFIQTNTPELQHCTGRGLMLIHSMADSVAIDAGLRTLYMNFSY